MKIPECIMEKAIKDFIDNTIDNTDTDTLADIAGYIFGGFCLAKIDRDGVLIYDFIPNDNYGGEFGEEE